MTTDKLLHLLRNPHGHAPWAVQAARLEAADLLERQAKELESHRARDYCMCGDRVDAHNTGSGHAPVSQYDHELQQLREELEQARKRAIDAEHNAIEEVYSPSGATWRELYDAARAQVLVQRELSLLEFALCRLASAARDQASAAAQDKQHRHYQPGAAGAFLNDARDAEALIVKLRAHTVALLDKEALQ